ncbi:MAG: DEAD/DEAH box helicase family protein, partial [Anaerolineae bacterium]|nr:DEAD/DEAH box helicase family protein [Anaerolineae bacterium]
MAKKRQSSKAQLALLEAKTPTAPCVPAIREKVKEWRDSNYKGATETSRLLLNHWFYTDHRVRSGRKFAYHYFQQEAIETLIYLYEVANIRRHKTLVETYTTHRDLHLLQYDDFTRHCVKMATGSGKTKVMSLAVAWHYFNAVAEARQDYAKIFLLIAPNVIVFERLRTDFEGSRIFLTDPIIPDELRIYWDFQCYMRGESERASSLGALYLTNIQQFYERPGKGGDEPEIMTAMLGSRPPADKIAIQDFDQRITKHGGPIVVLNDEAHHTHDEESEWSGIIRQLHSDVNGGIAAQLDFTATPRHTKGELFSWTVFDY